MRRSLHQPQLVSPITAGAEQQILLSCSREVERGARTALFTAPGLFRLDTVLEGDALRTVVRNLSPSELDMIGSHHNKPGTNIVLGGAGVFEPARATIAFRLRSPVEEIGVEVTIGTLLLFEHGLVRISGQAVLQQTRRAGETGPLTP